jgi:methyltransferase
VPAYSAAVVLLVIGVTMLVEARRSSRNARALRRQGAVEPRGDVYRLMQVAYPACFAGMGSEGALGGVATPAWFLVGAAAWLAAKGLKYWAIAALGERWCFRVLVPPMGRLVQSGPYRWLRHPNYLAVMGELAGAAIMLAAPFTGVAALLGFGTLLVRRIRLEEAALYAEPGERQRLRAGK